MYSNLLHSNLEVDEQLCFQRLGDLARWPAVCKQA